MSATQSRAHRRTQNISPERLLVGYVMFGFGLLVRAVGRVFGVSREEGSTLLTLIILASGARAVRRASSAPRKQVQKVRSSPSFAGDTLIGTAALRETVDSIAGRPSRNIPFAAALIAFAVLAHSFRPAVVGSLGALRKSVRAVITQGLKLRGWFGARGAMIAARTRDVVVEAAGGNPDGGADQLSNGDR
jgi:hypothetical protein